MTDNMARTAADTDSLKALVCMLAGYLIGVGGTVGFVLGFGHVWAVLPWVVMCVVVASIRIAYLLGKAG